MLIKRFLFVAAAAFLMGATLPLVSCGGDPDPVVVKDDPDNVDDPDDPDEPGKPPVDPIDVQVFKPGTDGYAFFRIPTMVITKNDVVLAFAEGRVNNVSDVGDIDLVLKRSTDGGKTWGPLIKVRDDGTNRCRNPSPVYIESINRVILVSCWNQGSTGVNHVFTTYSDDEGLTWSEHKDITSSVKPSNYVWYAIGPCHGIVLERNVQHKGRIIMPCNHNRSEDTSKGYSHVIYSDDNGATWRHGGTVTLGDTNESTVVELSDGRVMLNMRENAKNTVITNRSRYVATSEDGGITFGDARQDRQLPEPVCQASIFYYGTGTDGKGQLLFSNPPNQESRRHGTIRLSVDDGVTWGKKLQYSNPDAVDKVGYSSYSDIAVFSDNTIGVLVELGFDQNRGIWLRTMQLSDLK